MKTKSIILSLMLTLIWSAASSPLWAQVGTLTQTGAMTVCVSSTEPFAVVPTAGSVYSWSILAGSGGMGTIIDGPAPNNLISVNWTTAGTCTLQVIESAASCTGIPVTIVITVLPPVIPGTVSADQTIAFNGTPAPLLSTAPTGGNGTYTYQWEFSVDGGTSWAAAPGATGLTFAPGALSQTTLYRQAQTSAGSCGAAFTNYVTITVLSQLVAGTATASQGICFQDTPVPVTATEPTGGEGTYTYQWEYSEDGGSTWTAIAGAVGLTYAPGSLAATTWYHLLQTSGGSGTVTTNTVIITVQPQVITSPIWHK